LPLWLQKSFGHWTSFAGGGYWFNKTAAGDKDFWQTGWELQRNFGQILSVGAEIFYFTPEEEGGLSETGMNLGVIINFNEEAHFVMSTGGDIHGPNAHFTYAAFLWTV
jgi:hypothetical protein